MPEHDLKSRDLQGALEALGSNAPTPGGGSAAALAGALGASLVRMLAVLTAERPQYADKEKLMRAIAEQAEEARAHLLDWADRDAEAYDEVLEAMRLPHETDDEQATRHDAIQAALRGATEVPLRVMEECLQVISLGKNVVEAGARAAVSDGAVGAVLARAGLTAASFNVKTNLVEIEDEEYVQMTRTRLDEMMYMGTKVCAALDSYVNDLWTRA